MQHKKAVSRAERRRQEFQGRIRSAALRLFENNGITNTSVASIIKEADIAHKTFFNHFPTKDHLLEFLVAETIRSAFGGFDFEGAEGGAAEQLEASLMQIASSMAGSQRGMKEVVSYYFIGIEGPSEIRHKHTGEFYNHVRRILARAKREGDLREGYSVDALANVVVGLYSSNIMNWVSHDDYPLEARMKASIRFIKDTVFRGG